MTHVLYADDDPQLAGVLGQYFSRYVADWTLDVVSTGRDCLAAMAHHKYDVLLLDLAMPDIDGLHVLGELSARHDDTPVIMVSGYGRTELAVRAIRAGAVNCIDKNSTEFCRIHEVIRDTLLHRTLAPPALSIVEPPRKLQVPFFDSDHTHLRSTVDFFVRNAPNMVLVPEPFSSLEDYLSDGTPFDAIVLGPLLNADQVLMALRQLLANRRTVPVIVVARGATCETAIAAFKLGACDFLLDGPERDSDLILSLNHALRLAGGTKTSP